MHRTAQRPSCRRSPSPRMFRARPTRIAPVRERQEGQRTLVEKSLQPTACGFRRRDARRPRAGRSPAALLDAGQAAHGRLCSSARPGRPELAPSSSRLGRIAAASSVAHSARRIDPCLGTRVSAAGCSVFADWPRSGSPILQHRRRVPPTSRSALFPDPCAHRPLARDDRGPCAGALEELLRRARSAETRCLGGAPRARRSAAARLAHTQARSRGPPQGDAAVPRPPRALRRSGREVALHAWPARGAGRARAAAASVEAHRAPRELALTGRSFERTIPCPRAA